MDTRRFLCSDLVLLKANACESIVNLEEIWRGGAVLESEIPLESGTRIQIRCGTQCFAGRISNSEAHEFGWRVEVEFSPLTPWTIEQFRPRHLMDPAKIGQKDTEGGTTG
jgi:hypothetical protein